MQVNAIVSFFFQSLDFAYTLVTFKGIILKRKILSYFSEPVTKIDVDAKK